jgi:hypothetical protein
MLHGDDRKLLLMPTILCGAMLLCAIVTSWLAGVNWEQLPAPYYSSSLAITFVSALGSAFFWVLQLARIKADAPLKRVGEKLRERAIYLLLPTLLFPLFVASFTAVKTAIPFLVGYSWDPVWAAADRLIFRDDAWRIAYHWLGRGADAPLEWFYSVGWGLTLIFVMALVPLNAAPRFTVKFYSAMMATWLIGGVALAYLFSAAGPVFAHLAGSGPDQFADLRRALDSTLPADSPIRLTENYLASAVHSHIAVKGGGISAMPSMHLGVASIYVLAARKTPWLAPAILFWLIIFIASAYFGYHYWVDGIVAAAVAAMCWAAAERYPAATPYRSGFRISRTVASA